MQAAPHCPQCNSTVGFDHTFCIECGAPLAVGTSSQVPVNPGEISCPSCRAVLPPDSAFCSECGQAIGATEPTSQLAQQMDYSSVNFCMRFLAVGEQEIQRAYSDPEGGVAVSLLQAGRYELGLILTDLGKLKEKLGAGFAHLEKTLQEYLAYSIGCRRAYFLLDVSDNVVGKLHHPSWQQVLGLVSEASGFLKQHMDRPPASIFILGDDDVIPMARFPNLIMMDPDREVESDLVYSTLTAEDPWRRAKVALVPQLEVGRLPLGESFGPEKFAHYLANIHERVAHPPVVSRVTGISAKVWEPASQAMYSRLGGGFVKTSPELGLQNVLQEIDVEAAIQYYNLHGTDTDEFWYGEYNFEYPRTFGPEMADHMGAINAIGVEACYGAKFIGCQEADSILMRSLSRRTLGFLGSSKIAFGPVVPPNSLADVIVGEFLLAVQDGRTFGEATNLARTATMNQSLLDGLLVKTILSFNLFGDPMEKLLDQGLSLGQINFDDLRVEIPDVLQEIKQTSVQLKSEWMDQVRSQLKIGIPELNEVQPQVVRQYLTSLDKEVNCLYYRSPDDPARATIVYADDEGRLLGEFTTK